VRQPGRHQLNEPPERRLGVEGLGNPQASVGGQLTIREAAFIVFSDETQNPRRHFVVLPESTLGVLEVRGRGYLA
jgi:hypothetical protein